LVAIGCSLWVVIVFSAMGFFLWSLVQPQAFSNGCVPSDFPIYPASGWTGESFGDTDCRISQTTFDDADRVIDYYKGKLNGSKWTITSIDRSHRRIFFSHALGATIKGVLYFVGARSWLERVLPKPFCIYFNHLATAGSQPQLQTESIAMRSGRPWVCAGALPQPSPG
jgi:hypothetical protein